MVQVIQGQQAPSIGQAFGEGLQSGMANTMQYKLSEMLQQQTNTKKGRQLLEALGPETLKAYGLDNTAIETLAPLGPDMLSAVMKIKAEQSGLRDMLEAETGGMGGNNQTGGTKSPDQNFVMNQQQARRLPAGTAPMLLQEDMPAEEEAPLMAQQQLKPITSRTEPKYGEPKKSLDETVNEIKQKWNDKILKAKTESQRKDLIARKDKNVDQATKQFEANARVEKSNIERQRLEREQKELPSEVLKKYLDEQESYRNAEESIQSIDNINNLLESGAQLPELVTTIYNRLGKESALGKFAESLARNNISSAVDTARIEMLKGMRDVFGGQIRVAEFQEYVKKLQDVKDPAIANKIKGQLLKQMANVQKLKYQGLQQAINEDRTAPSDVILSRANEITGQLSADYFKKQDAKINFLTHHDKYPGQTLMFGPDGSAMAIPNQNVQAATQRGATVAEW